MAGSPKIAIMILNLNGLKWLPGCLSTVMPTESPNIGVYVVDNASTDESVHYIREHFPSVKVIRHSTNLGFAAGYNRAIQELKADYVVLLNNDTEVLAADWVRSLVEVATSDERVAAVACKMVSMERPDILDSVGGVGIPYWRGFVDIGRGERDEGHYDEASFEPFSFCGGAALIRRALFEQVGGFDEKFFMFSEDVDLSWRFRLLGYRVGFAPEAKVAHSFSGSTNAKTVDLRKLYLCYRNLLRAILKNCGPSIGWAVRNYLLFSVIDAIVFSVAEPRKAIAIANAILWNLVNLRDTYSLRLTTQMSLRVSEEHVLRAMYLGSKGYRPTKHAMLRRIIDNFFERSQPRVSRILRDEDPSRGSGVARS